MVCRAPSKPGGPGRSPTRKSKPEWQLTSYTRKQRSTTPECRNIWLRVRCTGVVWRVSALLQSAARPATPVTGCSCSWGLIYGMNEMTSLCNYRCNVEWGRDTDATDCARVPFYANTVCLLTAVTGPALQQKKLTSSNVWGEWPGEWLTDLYGILPHWADSS